MEANFTPIEDILPPPRAAPTIPRNDRIAHLEDQLKRLKDGNASLADTNTRRLEMVRSQHLIRENLEAEIIRLKGSLEQLQGRYNATIERLSAQEGQIRDHKAEIDHLQKLVAELEPAVATLRRYDLELKTYRLAMRVVYQLLKDSDAHTSINDILARCKQRVLDVDSSNGIHHPQANIAPLSVAGYVDDIASEASGPSDDEDMVEDHGHIDFGHSVNTDDEDDDLEHLAGDVDEHGNIRGLIDDEEEGDGSHNQQRKRKRAGTAYTNKEQDEEPTPHTPIRARVPSTFGKGAQPFTPPSSGRKIKAPSSSERKKLPRMAKATADGTGFYRSAHTGSHLQWK